MPGLPDFCLAADSWEISHTGRRRCPRRFSLCSRWCRPTSALDQSRAVPTDWILRRDSPLGHSMYPWPPPPTRRRAGCLHPRVGYRFGNLSSAAVYMRLRSIVPASAYPRITSALFSSRENKSAAQSFATTRIVLSPGHGSRFRK